MDAQDANSISGWAVLELMGHTQIAGYVQSETIAGMPFICLNVPEIPDVTYADGSILRKGIPSFTKHYAPGAIYAITFTDEETARTVAANLIATPINPFYLRTTYGQQREREERDGIPL